MQLRASATAGVAVLMATLALATLVAGADDVMPEVAASETELSQIHEAEGTEKLACGANCKASHYSVVGELVPHDKGKGLKLKGGGLDISKYDGTIGELKGQLKKGEQDLEKLMEAIAKQRLKDKSNSGELKASIRRLRRQNRRLRHRIRHAKLKRGPRGAPGNPGPQGDQGAKGKRGRRGGKGKRGKRGAKGPKGNPGIDGKDGKNGLPGRNGRRGSQGPPGSMGLPGKRGSQGRRGKVGPPGKRGLPGNRGITGRTGPRGRKGIPGIKGPRGPRGKTGKRGAPGARGLTGKRGFPGHHGRRGPRGFKGKAGLIGHRGAQGKPGRPGPPGFPGPTGRKGPRGYPGPKGRRGIRGRPGIRGIRGARGNRGHNGRNGHAGHPGHNGHNGRNGHTGRRGPRGPRGSPGRKGAPGNRGPTGFPGHKGRRGNFGPKGKKGKRGLRGPRGRRGPRGLRGRTRRVTVTRHGLTPRARRTIRHLNRKIRALKARIARLGHAHGHHVRRLRARLQRFRAVHHTLVGRVHTSHPIVLQRHQNRVNLIGMVINFLNNRRVKHAKVVITKAGGGAAGHALSNAEGKWTIALAPGNYKVQLVKTGFQAAPMKVKIVAGRRRQVMVSGMSPKLPAHGIRFVLRWGNHPRDLDSHLELPHNKCKVYWRKRVCSNYGRASLDYDSTRGHGPETVTISIAKPGTYKYKVKAYTSDGSLATSGARVYMFYNGGVKVFKVEKAKPAGGRNGKIVGRFWYVTKYKVDSDLSGHQKNW